MDEETKYRVEPADKDEETEKKGLFRPLPKYESPVSTRGTPLVRFMGRTMREETRDRLLLLLIPLCTAIIDATIYTLILIKTFTTTGLYMYGLPVLAAVPIGLVSPDLKNGLLGAIVASVFFVIIYMGVLITPLIIAPTLDLGGIFMVGLAVTLAYFLIVVLMSFLGALVGGVLREFF